MKRIILFLFAAIFLITLALGLTHCSAKRSAAVGEAVAEPITGFFGGVEKQAIVNDGRAQIAGYEYFYDQLGSIKASAQKVQFASNEYEKKAVSMVLVGMIEEYNARAQQVETRAKWMADNLPKKIFLSDFIQVQ